MEEVKKLPEADWIMELPISYEERGKQIGREEGRIEGRKEGRIEGRIEGRNEGRIEGRIEGLREGYREVALAMLKKGLSVAEVAEYTMLDVEEIRELWSSRNETSK